MADPNRFKSEDDILNDEITSVTDHIMETIVTLLLSHKICLKMKDLDSLSEKISGKLHKRGPLRD